MVNGLSEAVTEGCKIQAVIVFASASFFFPFSLNSPHLLASFSASTSSAEAEPCVLDVPRSRDPV